MPAGMDAMHNILALQTPLHEVTVGSGCKLSIQTCPTYPSLLHTHTSCMGWPEEEQLVNVGAAHVNWRPARVFLIGTEVKNSGDGLRSTIIAVIMKYELHFWQFLQNIKYIY